MATRVIRGRAMHNPTAASRISVILLRVCVRLFLVKPSAKINQLGRRFWIIDIIGDSVYLFHANLFDLTRQTARVLGCDQPDARRVRPYAASLCCGLCCPLSARQDLGRQGASTPERRRRQRHFVTDARQAALHPRLPEDQYAANYARLAI